ncbi:HAD family phosphatase [Candidatus Woesearchaeota archaeon]|nr:HAD family phosphatase [Candidatus Woesearchaeota archaeon]
MIKAIIFDMDGTLIDTGKIGFDVMEDYVKKKGLRYNKEHIKEIAFRSFADILKEVLDQNGKEYIPSMREELIREYKSSIRNAKPLPYSIEILENLHQDFIMILATLSLTEIAESILGENDMMKYFDLVVCADTTKINNKREMISNIIRETGLSPDEFILVEDSHYGIKSGMDNGIFTVGVKHSFDDIEADVTVEDLVQAEKEITRKCRS